MGIFDGLVEIWFYLQSKSGPAGRALFRRKFFWMSLISSEKEQLSTNLIH